jgi:uncharacterized membrane protein
MFSSELSSVTTLFSRGGGLYRNQVATSTGIVSVAIYYIVQNIMSKNRIGQAKDLLIDILKIRYAKGEITKEEFDRMKKKLQ